MSSDQVREATELRGRLSEIFFTALLEGQRESLAKRLGALAKVYLPLFGACSDLGGIETALAQEQKWLKERGASFERRRTLVGSERDVCEGILHLTSAGPSIDLPAAVVVERIGNRQVDVRVYHATMPLERWQAQRQPRGDGAPKPAVADDVAAHLGALRMGDVDSVLGTLETNASLSTGKGQDVRGKDDNLKEFYIRLLQSDAGSPNFVPMVLSATDDGRFTAIEYESSNLRGGEIAPKEGLLVFERGDSGLFSSVRFYDDLGA